MKQHIHFHFYTKLLAIIIVLVASIFLLQKSENIAANDNPPNPVEIGGWAWNDSVGWISLNCENDFDGDGLVEDTCPTAGYPYKLSIDPSSNNLVGCAWGGTSKNNEASSTIGYICFSDPGSTEAPTYGINIITSGDTGRCWRSPTSCTTSATCDAGETCIDDVCNAGECFSHADCNEPGKHIFQCTEGRCMAACTDNSDCNSGETCQLFTGENYLCPNHLYIAQSYCAYEYDIAGASILDLENITNYPNYNYSHKPWTLKFDQGFELNTSTWNYGDLGHDPDNPQWNYYGPNPQNIPIEGCFNCREQRIGHCKFRTGISCIEGDTVCEDTGPVADDCDEDGYCTRGLGSCDTNDDCSAVTDYCEIDDVEYMCDNCLDYYYYDKINSQGRADQCSYSSKSCEYTDGLTFANGYPFRRAITIKHGEVYGDDNLVNFPLLFGGTYDYLAWTGRGGDVENIHGNDIVFALDGDGNNPLDHDLDYYDFRSGEIMAWVRIPTLATSTDTTIYMFYGKPGVTASTEQVASVWTDYYFVSHMNDYGVSHIENNASTSLELGVKQGDGPTQANNGIGNAQSFDGVDDYIDFGDIKIDALPITMSVWSNTASDEVGNQPYSFITTDDTSSAVTGAWLLRGPTLEVGFGDGSSRQRKASDNYYPSGTKYFHGVIGSTDIADMKIYRNGEEITDFATAGSVSSFVDTSASLKIGYRDYPGATTTNHTGTLDEVRIAKYARSDGWIETEYDNISPSDTYIVSCRQRPGTDDDVCNCSNSDYISFGCDTSCDICERHEVDEFQKVLGGYDCRDCTIQDFTNSCDINSYGQNLNSCTYCKHVFTSPGVMLDNSNNEIPTTTTSGCDPSEDDPGHPNYCKKAKLCGWGSNSWTGNDGYGYGLGWIQFSPRITTTSKPYFSVEGGNIYSKGSIFSRYLPPVGKYNATYIIEAGGEITNIVSSSTISDTYEGELSYRPTLDFFELLTVNGSDKYKSSLGLIDYTGLITDVTTGLVGAGINKYGSVISTSNLIDILDEDFDGKIKYVSGDYTFDSTGTDRDFQISAADSTGIIVIDGDLNIDQNIYYEAGAVTTYKQIPSLVWIVRGDVIVDPSVTQISGTFVVLGDNNPSCVANPEAVGCGKFNSGSGTNQLTVYGSVLAHSFTLGRTYYDASGEPAEKFINEGRLQANPPKGLQDLNKLSPRYSF